MISIRTLNRDPDIWGPDAHEFKQVVTRLFLHMRIDDFG